MKKSTNTSAKGSATQVNPMVMTVGLPEEENTEKIVETTIEVTPAIVSATRIGVNSLYGIKPPVKSWRKDLQRECKMLDPKGDLFKTLSKAVEEGTVIFPEVSHKVQ